jgi:tetratricopeptide (TPR) repeat protein
MVSSCLNILLREYPKWFYLCSDSLHKSKTMTDQSSNRFVLFRRELQAITNAQEKIERIFSFVRSYGKENYAESRTLCTDALALARTLSDNTLIAQAIAYSGIYDFYLTDYEDSYRQSFDALQMFESMHNDAGKSLCYRTLGSIHLMLGEYDRSAEYYHLAMTNLQSDVSPKEYGLALMNMGTACYNQHDYRAAEDYYKQSLTAREAANDVYGVAECLSNLAGLYATLKDYGQAETFGNKALALAKETNYDFAHITALVNLGECYLYQENTSRAVEVLEEAITLSKSSDDRRYLWQALDTLATAYKKTHRFEQALSTFEESVAVRDSQLGDQVSAKIKRIEIRHAAEQQRKDDELSIKDVRIRQLEDIVTICAWSGQINLNGKWVRVEEFLKERFGLSVTHGISEEYAKRIRKQYGLE